MQVIDPRLEKYRAARAAKRALAIEKKTLVTLNPELAKPGAATRLKNLAKWQLQHNS